MGAYSGPDVVESGLVLSLDAANTKSHSGQLVTNGTFNTDISGWYITAGNGTLSRQTNIFANGAIQLSVSDSVYTSVYSDNINVTPGQTYTVSWSHHATNGATARVIVWDGGTATRLIEQYQNSSNNIVNYSINIQPSQNYVRFMFDSPGAANGTQQLDNISIISATWTDLSGSGNNGTLVNGPTYSTANGGSLVFDGVNDYVSLPAGFSNFPSGLTISAIVNFGNASSWERIIDFGNGSANNNILFARNSTSNTLTFEIYNGITSFGKCDVSNGILNNTTAQYTATINGTTCSIYRNGGLLQSFSYPYLPVNITRNNCYIGRSNWADAYFETSMNNIMIYNRALTESEIQQNYIATKSRFGL